MGNKGIRFQDVIDVPKLQSLMDSFHKAFSTLMAILDTNENVLVAVGWQDICTRYHRLNPQTCARCKASDAYIKQNLRAGEYIEYKCQNGLWDVATPIIINGEHVATFFTGQFFYEGTVPDTAFFRRQARDFGFPEDEYLKALEKVPIYSRQKVRDLMEYYMKYVQTLVDFGLVQMEKERYGVTLEVRVAKRTGELSESEKRLAEAQRIAKIGSWEWDIASGANQWSDEQCHIFGFEPGSVSPDYDFFMNALLPEDRPKVRAALDDVIAGRTPYSIDCRIAAPDGAVKHIHCEGVVKRDPSGKPLRMAGTVQDITARKRAEEELLRSQAVLQKAQQTARLGNWTWDIKTNHLEWSAEMYAIFGVDRGSFSGDLTQAISQSIHPEDRPLVERSNISVISEGKPVPAEYRVIWPDGSVHWIYAEAGDLVRDESGNPALLTGIAQDITERKMVEDALRLENEITTRAAQGVILVRASDGVIIFANRHFETMFGYAPGELVGRPVTDINAPQPGSSPEETAASIISELKRTGHWHGEVFNRKKDGTVFWTEAYVSTYKHPVQGELLITHQSDITGRKQAEEELLVANERLDFLLTNALEGVFVHDCGVIVDANDQCARLFGYEPREFIGVQIFDHTIPAAWESIREHTASGSVETYEVELTRRDGTRFFAETNGRAITYRGRSLRVATIRDVTPRKRAEEQAIKSQKLVQNLIDSGDSVIYALDLDGKFLFVNKKFSETFQISPAELVGRPRSALSFMQPHIAEQHRNNDLIIIRERASKVFEEINEEKDGKHTYLSQKFPLFDANGAVYGVCGISTDITERKNAETELRIAKEAAEEATKLKDKFVSLVSHDLKTPLSTMILALNLIRCQENGTDAEGNNLILDQAIDRAKQMTVLINDLLSVSRVRTGQVKLEKRFFDAKFIAAKMAADYAYLAEQKGIALHNLVPENIRIFGDRTLVTQAMQNLVTNAIKFCKKGDTITLSLSQKDGASLCVRDTGPGIKPEVLEKIFKEGAKFSTEGTAGEIGTGLGLQLTKDIMDLHGGRLDAECELGKGCLFTMAFPFVRPRILLVDDDPNFRFLMEVNMGKLMADVAQAEDGQKALDAVTAARPHLIISDIKMPNMDGLELLRKLKDSPATRDIPVIMVSGEYGMEIRDTVFKSGAEDFIMKNDLDPVNLFPRVRRFIG